MKSLLFMPLFWKINKDYRILNLNKTLKENNTLKTNKTLKETTELEKLLDNELSFKKQYNEYLKYLEQKSTDIKNYFSIENFFD